MDVKRLIEDLHKTHSETLATDSHPSERLLLIAELMRTEIAEQVRKIVWEELLPELTRLFSEQTDENAGQFQIDQLRQLIREELRTELRAISDASQPEKVALPESQPPVIEALPAIQSEISSPTAPSDIDQVPHSDETADLSQPAMMAEMLKPLEEANLRLGIDFGTTTTAVSVRIGQERPIAIPIGRDGITRYIPSVVYINPGPEELGKRILVGEEADGMTDETKKIRSIKRCLDCNGKSCSMFGKPADGEKFPWCSVLAPYWLAKKSTSPLPKLPFLSCAKPCSGLCGGFVIHKVLMSL